MKAWRRTSTVGANAPAVVTLLSVSDDGGGDFTFTFSSAVSGGPLDLSKLTITDDITTYTADSLVSVIGNQVRINIVAFMVNPHTGTVEAGSGLTFSGGGVFTAPQSQNF